MVLHFLQLSKPHQDPGRGGNSCAKPSSPYCIDSKGNGHVRVIVRDSVWRHSKSKKAKYKNCVLGRCRASMCCQNSFFVFLEMYWSDRASFFQNKLFFLSLFCYFDDGDRERRLTCRSTMCRCSTLHNFYAIKSFSDRSCPMEGGTAI